MSLLVSAPTQFEIFGSINGSAYNIFPFSSLLFIHAPVATVQINFISFQLFRRFVTHWNTIPSQREEHSCAVQPKANLSGSVESSKFRIVHRTTKHCNGTCSTEKHWSVGGFSIKITPCIHKALCRDCEAGSRYKTVPRLFFRM